MSEKHRFSEILKYLRNQENWSQSYLADKLDISTGTYSSYERGLSDPALSTLIKLSSIFKVSIDFLAQGKEFPMPLTPEETNIQHLDRMTLRLENRMEGQTRLLNHISRKLENDLSSIVKRYSEDFVDIFSRSSGVLLLEEEIWDIEQCSQKTRVAYPNADEFINYDAEKKEYYEVDYFQNLVSVLREYPENQYIEIYAKDSNLDKIERYKKLIEKQCGKAALKRLKMWKCNQPIIASYAIYSIQQSMLRDKYPSVFKLIEDSIFDDSYLAIIVTPRYDSFGVNFLADKKHCRYIIDHFDYLLKESVRI